jgi:DNA replication protein DnaC
MRGTQKIKRARFSPCGALLVLSQGETAKTHQPGFRRMDLKTKLDDLNTGHADGSYRAKKTVLILDDWGLEKLSPRQSADLLEVVEDRYGRGSTILISQLPVTEWYKMVSNPTVADALMDRLVHNSHRLELSGESLRKVAQSDHGE